MEEAVAEVSTCGRNHKARTITKAVASCNHPAKVDSIKNTTPETPKAPNMPQKNSQALDTGTYKVLRSSQLDRTILARQERETGELTFRLLPKAIMVPVPKGKWVTARILAALMKIRISHVAAFSGLKHHVGYITFQYARASPTMLTMLSEHKLPMLIDGGSEICVMREEVAIKLNIRSKHADWKRITANRHPSDLTNVAESVPVNDYGIIIPRPISLAKSGSEQYILGRPWKTYTQKRERNLDNGSCKITISAIDSSEQVSFIATFPGDWKDRFASSSGIIYA